jgi:hypothetical protein
VDDGWGWQRVMRRNRDARRVVILLCAVRRVVLGHHSPLQRGQFPTFFRRFSTILRLFSGDEYNTEATGKSTSLHIFSQIEAPTGNYSGDFHALKRAEAQRAPESVLSYIEESPTGADAVH